MDSMPPFPPPVDVDNPGRGPMIIAVTWLFTIIAGIAMGLWIYVRKERRIVRGWEDWLMLGAVLFRFANQIQITVSLKDGFGKHDYSLTPQQLVAVLKANWMSLPVGMVPSILARISIAILLIRIFGVHKWFTAFMIISCVIQTVVGIAFIPMTFLQARPVEALWNIFIMDAQRWDPRIWLYTAYTIQTIYTFSDLTYVLFPVLIIWKLKMPIRRKIGLMILMGMSLFTMSMSILKTVWIAQISKATMSTPDVQYNASLSVLWGCLEQDFVIIMGCVPAMRGILNIEMPRLKAFGSQLSTLVGKSSRGKQSSMGESTKASAGYYDLEMRKGKFGHSNASSDVQGPTAAYTPRSESNDHLVGANRVMRTDQYTVSYDK